MSASGYVTPSSRAAFMVSDGDLSREPFVIPPGFMLAVVLDGHRRGIPLTPMGEAVLREHREGSAS